jgi:hypothetical protein
MNIMKKIATVFLLLTLGLGAYAADTEETTKPMAKLKDASEFEEVISEYKAYVSKIPPKVRDEIIEYRKSIAKLNKQKRELYQELSQASQNYLKQEQQYKKRLPLKSKGLINLETPGEKVKKNKD